MLNIGEFSVLTGISVKALRHYDGKGVLTPTFTEEWSNYRKYGENQVRDGVIVRALRDAGVPLAEIATVTGHRDRRNDGGADVDGEFSGEAHDELDVLRTHRRRILEEREREDEAFVRAEAVLLALGGTTDRNRVRISERRRSAQPYVGRVLPVGEDLTDDKASAVLGDLHGELLQEGIEPSGHFWTVPRMSVDGVVELACCWPVPVVPDRTDFGAGGGVPVEVGTLPERHELVVSWITSVDDPYPETVMHPAVVALYDELATRGIDMTDIDVRQSIRSEDGDNLTFTGEMAMTLEPNTTCR